MSANKSDSHPDEQVLIDYVLKRCDEPTVLAVRQRLETDAAFASLHRDIAHCFAALGCYESPEPPANLLERTMARIRASRSTETLLKVTPIARAFRAPTFSLRELAAIAAAIVVMVGILVPTLRQTDQVRKQSQCAANQGQIGTGLGHYASEHGELLPASLGHGNAWLPSGGERVASNSAGIFGLVGAGYVQPGAFQCPAVGGKSFAVAAGMTDFPSAQNNNYNYQHSLSGPLNRAAPELRDLVRQMAILSDASPVFANGTFSPERVTRQVSDSHNQTGQNVLYLDMHVDWATGARVGVNGNNIWLAEGVVNYTGTETPVSPADSFLLPNANR